MSTFKYHITDAIAIEINVSKLSEEYLSTLSQALTTESELRNSEGYKPGRKTVVHMEGTALCIGNWPLKSLNELWYSITHETLRRFRNYPTGYPEEINNNFIEEDA